MTSSKEAVARHFQIGHRVRLGDSKTFTGTVIGYHDSRFGVGWKKEFHGYRIQWDNAGIGICETSDLQLINP